MISIILSGLVTADEFTKHMKNIGNLDLLNLACYFHPKTIVLTPLTNRLAFCFFALIHGDFSHVS
jgi:hypothetical protein